MECLVAGGTKRPSSSSRCITKAAAKLSCMGSVAAPTVTQRAGVGGGGDARGSWRNPRRRRGRCRIAARQLFESNPRHRGAGSGGARPKPAWRGAHPTHPAMAAKPCLPLAAFPDAPRRYGGSQRGRQRQPLSASSIETALPTETCVAATGSVPWVSDTSCREGYPARVCERHGLSDRPMAGGDNGDGILLTQDSRGASFVNGCETTAAQGAGVGRVTSVTVGVR